MTKLHLAFVALASTLIAGCSPAHGQPALKLEACTVPRVSEPLMCGRLPVPEDRTRAGGRTISLNVVVVPATGTKTGPPFYDIAGGPGLAATDAADFWAGHPLRASRDIVLVDQRGTGRSVPLPCELEFSNPFEPLLDPQAVNACRERLSRDHDLARFSTAAAVADLDAVRAALGHERVDLSGLSYGTRVAQEYLRHHPDRVRAMVLLGAVHPGDKLPLNYSRNAEAVLDTLVRQCAADSACHSVIPDLGSDLAKLRRALDAGPVNVELPEGRTASLEAGPFWEAVRRQLTTTSGQRRLPWLLHEAAAGRFAPVLTVMAPPGGPDGFSNGMLLSVVCPEDTLRITDAELAAAGTASFGTHRLRAQIAACQAWGVAPLLDDPRPGLVRSDVPVLLMAGEVDHVTPASAAMDIASALPNGRVIRIPHLGHVPDEGISNLDCYDRLITEFLERGSARDLDAKCVETMSPAPFELDPEQAPVR